jgi:hypothetical protein
MNDVMRISDSLEKDSYSLFKVRIPAKIFSGSVESLFSVMSLEKKRKVKIKKGTELGKGKNRLHWSTE